MLYDILLLGGVRQDREYYAMLIGSIADDRQLARRLRSPNDMVPLEAILRYYKIVLKKRPIYWDNYSESDDPC